MIRILHVLGGLDRGGAETMVMNFYREIDRCEIQFDFIIHSETENDYRSEIEDMGGKIYIFPKFKLYNILSYRNEWKKFLKNHPEYKIIHSHVRSYASVFLPIAKNYGIKTIVHSHSTSNGKGFKAIVKYFLQRPLYRQADYLFSCSMEAGKWLFGENAVNSDKHILIPNAIDVDKYIFNEQNRNRIRKNLDLNNNIILGHVGRYDYQKNFPFLLDLMYDLKKIDSKYVLIQIGDGDRYNELRDEIKKKSLENNFILLGVRDDVPELMQSMDIFIFPSRNEGLGIVAVESQASGLPTLLSNRIPTEVAMTDLVKYISISNGTGEWIDAILNADISKRDSRTSDIEKAGYGIKEASLKLVEYYKTLLDI